MARPDCSPTPSRNLSQSSSTGSATDGVKDVSVSVTIPRVQDISTQEQTFEVQLKLQLLWVDPDPMWGTVRNMINDVSKLDSEWIVKPETQKELRLAPPESRTRRAHYAEQLVRGHKFFTPKLALANSLTPPEDGEKWYTVKWETAAYGPPTVRFNWIITARFQQNFNLRLFPFDQQDLEIELRAGSQSKEARLKRNETTRSVLAVTDFSEYKLLEHVLFDEPGTTDPKESASECQYSKLVMKLHVQRKSGFWVYNIMLPMLLITSALFATFATEEYVAQSQRIGSAQGTTQVDTGGQGGECARSVNDASSDNRLDTTLNILLAMVGFKTFAAERMPKIASSP